MPVAGYDNIRLACYRGGQHLFIFRVLGERSLHLGWVAGNPEGFVVKQDQEVKNIVFAKAVFLPDFRILKDTDDFRG